MEIKECTCRNERWVLDGIAKLLYCTRETNNTLYVNNNNNNNKTQQTLTNPKHSTKKYL